MPNHRRTLVRFAVASCAGVMGVLLSGAAVDSPAGLAISIVGTAQAQSHTGGSHSEPGASGGTHIGGPKKVGKKGGSRGKHGTGGHDDSAHESGAGKKGGKSGGKHSGGKHIDHEHTSAELTGGSDIEENVFRHSGRPTDRASHETDHEDGHDDESGHTSAQ